MKLPKYLRRALEQETRKDIFQRAVDQGFEAWEDGEQIEMLDGTVYEVQKDGSWRNVTLTTGPSNKRTRNVLDRRIRTHTTPSDPFFEGHRMLPDRRR